MLEKFFILVLTISFMTFEDYPENTIDITPLSVLFWDMNNYSSMEL